MESSRESIRFTKPCPCCRGRFNGAFFADRRFLRCEGCGFLEELPFDGSRDDAQRIKRHYRTTDPHQNVADSKRSFFESALDFLDARIGSRERRLLDVGCGYGYFLEHALRRGWRVNGLEIMTDAAKTTERRLPGGTIRIGTLQESGLEADMFDAVTLWDMLFHSKAPDLEILECFRILKPGGWIGIRVRNLDVQLALYRLQRALAPLLNRFFSAPLYVFHRSNFTPRSIGALLSAAGFVEHRIDNSPLTTGDPYGCSRWRAGVGMTKTMVGKACRIIQRASGNRRILGPSLLAWGRKP